MDGEARELAVQLLVAVGINASSFEGLHGMQLDRDVLIRPDAYTSAAVMIPQLRQRFSSTHLTCLQGHAPGQQRWPLLNLVRQVLRACGIDMMSKRVSAGYCPGRIKQYRRIFELRRTAVKTVKDKTQLSIEET